MKIFYKTLLFAMITCVLTVSNVIAIETKYDKFKTAEDLILWSGYDCPDRFDPSLIKDDITKKSALEKGLKLCEEKAKEGVCCNQELLGIYYYSEKKEFKKGLYWLNKCAEQGSSRGMYILSYAYVKGLGVVQDEDESFKWLYLAAAAGDEDAIKNLNILHSQFGFSHKTMMPGKKNAQVWMKENPKAFFNPDGKWFEKSR